MHGGDVEGYRRKYGREPFDLSTNVSPLGIPERVLNAAKAAVDHSGGYPDGNCGRLKAALSERYGISEEDILCFPGAADIIFRLAAVYRNTKALVVVPAFTEYERALNFFDCETAAYCLKKENGFLMTGNDACSIIEEIEQGIRIAFIGQPANPSGRVTDISFLERIACACDRSGTLLVIDECFLDFVKDHESFSLLQKLKDHRLVLIRSFTKMYAMAGLRIGYCFLGRDVPEEKLREAGQPWPVSNVSEAAAIAALGEDSYTDEVRRMVERQREYIKTELEKRGCMVIPSETNYLLFYHSDHDLFRISAGEGILIRDCSDYTGLGRGWYRIAVTDDDRIESFFNTIPIKQ